MGRMCALLHPPTKILSEACAEGCGSEGSPEQKKSPLNNGVLNRCGRQQWDLSFPPTRPSLRISV
jgi:hypothetical protein